MKWATLFLIFSILYFGCAMGPRYREPMMELPQSYRSYQTQEHGEAMIDLPWWKVFKDETLQQLIRETLLNNYDLRAAAARVDEARALVGVTRAQIFPQSDLTGSVSRERISEDFIPFFNRLRSTYLGGFNTTWEMDLWGKIRQAIRASKAEFLATENARRGVMVTLVADAAQTYFSLLELDLELNIAKKTLQTRKDNLDLFNKRLQGAAASGLETARAKADYEQTAAHIPEIERQIAAQENRLSELLGRNPGPILRPATVADQSVPVLPGSGLPSDLLSRRPDIMEAEQRLRASNAQVGVAVAEFMPRVDLINFVGGVGDRFSSVFGANDSKGFTWLIGGDLDLPLFKGGRNVYGYQAVKARWQESVAFYKQRVIAAFHEVADALVAIDKTQNVRKGQEKQVAALKEAVKLSRIRYQEGLSSYLEVIDADQQYYEAQNVLARTLGSQFIYYVQLYRALGGGWQSVDIKK